MAAPCALVVALAAAGCGEDSEADRVEAYIKDANEVTRTANPRFVAANKTFREFAEGDLKGRKAGKELRRAELDIEQVRQNIAALQPPPEARRLHGLLVRVYELNVLMAAEARQMAGYLPRAEQALDRIPGIQKRLQRGLRSDESGTQVRTLRRYARDIGAVVARLRELEAPAALVADRDTQLRRLGQVSSVASRLARAIAREDADAVKSLLARFRASDPQPELAGLGKTQIRAYRQRLTAIDRAASQARSERARLNRELLD